MSDPGFKQRFGVLTVRRFYGDLAKPITRFMIAAD
jgi:hypothetical protein